MVKREVREIDLDVSDFVSTKCGSMDRTSNNVLYIYAKCWITPTQNIDFNKAFYYERRNIDNDLSSIIKQNGRFYDKFISELSVTSDYMRVGEKRFLSLEVFLKAKDKHLENVETIKEDIKSIAEYTISRMENRLKTKHFDIRKEKNAKQ